MEVFQIVRILFRLLICDSIQNVSTDLLNISPTKIAVDWNTKFSSPFGPVLFVIATVVLIFSIHCSVDYFPVKWHPSESPRRGASAYVWRVQRRSPFMKPARARSGSAPVRAPTCRCCVSGVRFRVYCYPPKPQCALLIQIRATMPVNEFKIWRTSLRFDLLSVGPFIQPIRNINLTSKHYVNWWWFEALLNNVNALVYYYFLITFAQQLTYDCRY